MARLLGPGRYGLDAVQRGDRIETGRVTITAEAVDAFADLSGDHFAIHMSDAAAEDKGFPGRVAHGLLILSLVDGLKNQAHAQFDAIASLGWDWRFSAPVLIGDTIGAQLQVTDKRLTSNPDRGILTIEVRATNQNGAIVQEGVNRLMVAR